VYQRRTLAHTSGRDLCALGERLLDDVPERACSVDIHTQQRDYKPCPAA